MDGKTILIDCDGVLTDGALTIDHRGEKMFKRFHTRDVRAIRELVYNGFEVVIVTADDWPGIHHFADKVGAEVLIVRDKREAISRSCSHGPVGRPPEAVPHVFAAIGDDSWDVPMLAGADHAFCPSDADRSLRMPGNNVTILDTPGGRGVIAEMFHHIMAIDAIGMVKVTVQ